MGPHSWDPGTTPSLVFWTAAVPKGSAKVDLRKETASLKVTDLIVFDSFTLVPNALDPNHPAGHATALIESLEMHWEGTTRETSFSNCEPNAFRGHYFEDSATIKVIASTPPTPERCGSRASTWTTASRSCWNTCSGPVPG